MKPAMYFQLSALGKSTKEMTMESTLRRDLMISARWRRNMIRERMKDTEE